MKEDGLKTFLTQPIILGAIGVAAVIAVGSGFYYTSSTRAPQGVAMNAATTTDAVTGSGTIEPAQNPDLSFQSPGRIARISVAVGQQVNAGQVLASLDTLALSAQLKQAQAARAAQQASLDNLKAGARQVDIDAKQTAVNLAETTLGNVYPTIQSSIAQAYDKSFSGVSTYTDSLYNQPYTNSPTLVFSVSNNQYANDAISNRVAVNLDLQTWKAEINSLGSATSSTETSLASALAHLQKMRSFSDSLLEALGSTILTTNFSQSSLSSAQTSVNTLRDTINTQILTLQGLQQQLASDKLAVASAVDALNQLLAGSTPQAIAAQQAQVDAAEANVELVSAQIANATIAAPFSGTVSSVHSQVGDSVSAGTPIVSLTPESALQITIYLSEVDIAKIAVGDSADVTVDAYGQGRHWQATVISIDRSPTTVAGESGYKTTLQFANPDPSISSGMTANITVAINK